MLVRPFANRWLNLAIASQLALLGLVVYWRHLHEAFGTFYLTLEDWLIVGALALTVAPCWKP